MIKRLPEAFAIVFILIAISLAIRQQIVSEDSWFSAGQIWHHETLIAIFVFGAVCLIVGKYIGRLNR